MCAVQADSEGIVRLWGEDALLGWPGAMEPIIEERDAVMANVLRACASGVHLLHLLPYQSAPYGSTCPHNLQH